MRGRTGTEAYPEFPEIVEQIGYNPARWLHTRSVSGLDSRIGQTPEIAVAISIVKGIDDPKELAYWFKVERRCRNREHVLEKLEQRRRAILNDVDGFLKENQSEQNSDQRIAADGGSTGETDE